MSREVILSILKDKKSVLKDQFHIDRIGLFGSYSLNAQTPGSDIDLAIEFEKEAKLGIKGLYDLELYLEAALNTDNLDIVNLKYVNPLIEIEMAKSLIYV